MKKNQRFRLFAFWSLPHLRAAALGVISLVLFGQVSVVWAGPLSSELNVTVALPDAAMAAPLTERIAELYRRAEQAEAMAARNRELEDRLAALEALLLGDRALVGARHR